MHTQVETCDMRDVKDVAKCFENIILEINKNSSEWRGLIKSKF
jgi:putative aminopeptidase FrvX